MPKIEFPFAANDNKKKREQPTVSFDPRNERFVAPPFELKVRDLMKTSFESENRIFDEQMFQLVMKDQQADYPLTIEFFPTKTVVHGLLLRLKEMSESPKTTRGQYYETFNLLEDFAKMTLEELGRLEEGD